MIPDHADIRSSMWMMRIPGTSFSCLPRGNRLWIILFHWWSGSTVEPGCMEAIGERGLVLEALIGSNRYVVAGIGYRLSDEAPWPAQIHHDCKAAIKCGSRAMPNSRERIPTK